MSFYDTVAIRCKTCGHEGTAEVARGVNASRQPSVRDEIFDRTFHTVECEGCKRRLTLDKEFFYSDFDRGMFYLVKPKDLEPRFRDGSAELNRRLKVARPARAADIYEPRKASSRVVFGLDRLRENLLARNAGIDDRLLDVLKALLVSNEQLSPECTTAGIQLESVTDDYLEFIAEPQYGRDAQRARLPREAFASLLAERLGQLEAAAPQQHQQALELLRQFADTARAERFVDTTSPDFERMLMNLPSDLSNAAQADLRILQGRTRNFFERKMNIWLADNWLANDDVRDIPALYRMLVALPDAHVQKNFHIDRLQISPTDISWYRGRDDVIAIAAIRIANEDVLETYLYHEVGHAVHAKYDAIDWRVSSWLEDLGWRNFGSDQIGVEVTDREIDQWARHMTDYQALNESEKRQMREVIKQALGPEGTKTRPPLKIAGDNHPWNRNLGPRKAFDQSNTKWWENVLRWHHEGDWAYAYNYRYKNLMAVKLSVIAEFHGKLDDFAFYSQWEFFAELYRVAYDQNDPRRATLSQARIDRLYDMLGPPEFPI